MKENGADDRATLSKLVQKALEFQAQLDSRYQKDEFLRDILLRATATEAFSAMTHLNPPRTSTELIERLNLSIDARARISGSDSVDFIIYSNSDLKRITPAYADEFHTQTRRNNESRNNGDMFGRKYARNYAYRTQGT